MNENREQKSAIILPFERKTDTLTGGKGPTDGNYLSGMVPGTRFLAKSKHDAGSVLNDYILSTDPKTMPAVLLGKNVNSREGNFEWHDPIIFCKNNALYMTLEILEPDNGNSDKVHGRPVDSDGKSQVLAEVHEKE